ncbi:MAG TPA: tripartite tricarboxylate transporter substrate binding protein [Pseudolabrys sp.]|nr:tripartite tricarboxylate transporter substrate binding protein [Pseudolabrys sp.]
MRNLFAAVIAGCCALAGFAVPAAAQDYPQRPVHIIVGFGPGGGADIVSRILGQALQDKFGQPFVVENKPGAAGTLGNELVAKADKDGYTLGMMTAGQIIAATTNKGLRYDTLTAFEPIGQVATASLLIVTRPDFPASDVKGLVEYAKANPGKVVFGSAGFGATQHLSAELFMQTAGIKMLHVPFRTSPEAINAVISKQVDILFDTVSALIGQVQSNRLKTLAVTGKDRFPAVPDVPTAISSGLVPGYDVTTWYGVFGPKGIPQPIVMKLNAAINDVLKDEGVRKRLATAGVVVQGSTPEAFGAFMASEYKRWDKVREAAGIPKQ